MNCLKNTRMGVRKWKREMEKKAKQIKMIALLQLSVCICEIACIQLKPIYRVWDDVCQIKQKRREKHLCSMFIVDNLCVALLLKQKTKWRSILTETVWFFFRHSFLDCSTQSVYARICLSYYMLIRWKYKCELWWWLIRIWFSSCMETWNGN